MRACLKWMVCAWIALGAARAAAEPDTFGLGTGRDGALRVTAPGTRINAYAVVTSPLAQGSAEVRVSSAAGFGSGDLVLVLQTTGVVPEPASGNPWPLALWTDDVGRWELARVARADGGVLALTAPLGASYAAFVTQVIRVPEYTTVTIERGASLVPARWDGASGGVVAFLATRDVVNEGAIDASGMGARGGAYVQDTTSAAGCLGLEDEPAALGAQKGEGVAVTRYGPGHTGAGNVANGGGGGVCQGAGGGGGGNAGPGGQGGRSRETDGAREVGGLGGAMLAYSPLDHLTFGGGGGAGHGSEAPGWLLPNGGNGGGIVFIRGGRMLGRGAVLASGAAGGGAVESGGGGGGAGGTLYLRLAGTAACGRIAANGGAGGGSGLARVGPGGGGGGGRVLFQSAPGRDCALSAFDVKAGGAGTQPEPFAEGGVSYGAQPAALNTAFYDGALVIIREGFKRPGTAAGATPVTGVYMPGQLLTGTTVPGGIVVISVDGREVGRVRADAAGRYEFALPSNLTPGRHDVRTVIEAQSAGGTTAVSRSDVVKTAINCSGTPTVSVVPGSPVFTKSADMVFSLFSTGAGLTDFQCTVDGNANNDFASCPRYNSILGTASYTSSTTPAITAGVHTLYIRDLLGSPGPCVAITWTVDPNPPVLTLGTKPPSVSGSSSASISFSATDSTTYTFTCRNYTPSTATLPAFSTCTSPYSMTGLTNGPQIVEIMATDQANNTTLAAYTWTVDTLAPTLTVTGPTSPTPSNTVTVAFSAADATAVAFQCRHYLASTAPGSEPTFVGCSAASTDTVTGLADDAWKFEVKATDAGGNSSTQAVNVTVDTVKPQVTITGPTGVVGAAGATFTLAATDASTVTLQCRHYAWPPSSLPPFTTCTTGTYPPTGTITGSDGGHVLEVLATDLAKNTQTAVAQWIIDTTPPALAVTPPTSPTASSTVTVAFSATDATALTFQCRHYLASTSPGSEPAFGACSSASADTVSSLADGAWKFDVKATDAGNNSTTQTANVTVDTGRPQVTITGPTGVVGTAGATFTLAVTDATTVTLQCRHYPSPPPGPLPAFTACATGTYPASGTVTGPDGDHVLEVLATDAAKNTQTAVFQWNIDTTAPALTVTGPASPTPSSSVTVAFNAVDATAVTIQCRHYLTSTVPGLRPPFAACSGASTDTATGLADDTYRFEVKATDAANNATTQSVDVTVDTGLPQVTITGPTGVVGTAGATFTLAVMDTSTVTLQCRHYPSPPTGPLPTFSACVVGTYPASGTVTGPDGRHVLEVLATDAAKNTQTALTQWTIDTTAPTLTVTGPSSPAPSSTVTVAFNASDATAVTFLCRHYLTSASPSAFVACSGPSTDTSSGLADGTWRFEVKATDAASNATTQSVDVTVDTAPPSVTILTGPTGPTPTATASFTFQSADGSATFECSENGTTYTACTSAYAYQNGATLTDGQSYGFWVRAVDPAGNRTPTPASRSWTVDVTKPTVTIAQKPDPATNSKQAVFTFTTSEALLGFECTLDISNPTGTDYQFCTSPWVLENLGSGFHTVYVRGIDLAGNVSATTLLNTYTWQVDPSIPDTTIDTNPGPITNQPTVTFSFSSTVANPNYECALDDNHDVSFVSCPQTYPVTLSVDSTHTLFVRAVNSLGVKDSTPATFTWTLDRQAPTLQIQSGPPEFSNQLQATFKFFSDKFVRYACLLDGQVPSTGDPCVQQGAQPIFTGLTEGAHVLTVTAKDLAGNEVSRTYPWEISLSQPGTPVVEAPAAGSLVNRTPTIRGTADAGATVEVFVDQESKGTVTVDASGHWSLLVAGLLEGSHAVAATATNKYGSSNGPSPSVAFTVDTTPPVTTVDTPTEQIMNGTLATVHFHASEDATFECSLNSSPYTPCSGGDSFVKPDMDEGTYTLSIRATDLAQNAELTPVSVTWRVYLGKEDVAYGGGISCSSAGSGAPLALLGLVALALRLGRPRARSARRE